MQQALTEYRDVVEHSHMSGSTHIPKGSSKRSYYVHAEQFVRWLDDDFEPGATLK